MPANPERLCVFCRRLEPTSSPCPKLLSGYKPTGIPNTGPSLAAALPASDEALLASLQKMPSRLCQRCLEYDIVRVFRDWSPEVDDITRHSPFAQDAYLQDLAQSESYKMKFGELSDLFLSPSCQLCRLIYRVFPRSGLSPDDVMGELSPFLSYTQEPGWESLSEKGRSNGAISLGVTVATPMRRIGSGIFQSDENFQLAERTGESIALVSHQNYRSRTLANACLVTPMIDFDNVKRRLDYCDKNHGKQCHTTLSKEVLSAKMIDVEQRKVVQCPADCEYLALSYVWGGVIPVAGALESHQLPRTIEDAITVTKKLGKKYLWVDALCIEQNPSTPEQAAAKQQQLMIMDLIYSSAFITLVALTGRSSESGLPGVSSASLRPRQIEETIDGHTFFTVPQAHDAEHAEAAWRGRAWTLQEIVFSTKTVFFNDNQFVFGCSQGIIPEALDLQRIIPKRETWSSPRSRFLNPPKTGLSRNERDDLSSGIASLYTTLVQEYTARKMTRDEDSLNAFLGILSGMQRHLLPNGFIFGLPLADYPQSLGWIHDEAITPRRRLGFPTWSWAGWAGLVQIPETLMNPREERRQQNLRADLKPRFVSIMGQTLTVEGYVVDLDISTDPFSELLHPTTRESIGSIREGNHSHNNTIQTGKYTALIVQRIRYMLTKTGPEKERVFMMLLDWKGQEAERRTVVTFAPFSVHSIQDLQLDRRTIALI